MTLGVIIFFQKFDSRCNLLIFNAWKCHKIWWNLLFILNDTDKIALGVIAWSFAAISSSGEIKKCTYPDSEPLLIGGDWEGSTASKTGAVVGPLVLAAHWLIGVLAAHTLGITQGGQVLLVGHLDGLHDLWGRAEGQGQHKVR